MFYAGDGVSFNKLTGVLCSMQEMVCRLIN